MEPDQSRPLSLLDCPPLVLASVAIFLTPKALAAFRLTCKAASAVVDVHISHLTLTKQSVDVLAACHLRQHYAIGSYSPPTWVSYVKSWTLEGPGALHAPSLAALRHLACACSNLTQLNLIWVVLDAPLVAQLGDACSAVKKVRGTICVARISGLVSCTSLFLASPVPRLA